MNKEILLVFKGGVGEIVEKKSKFIANIIPIKNETEAIQHIDNIRKENWNATHNCYAYVIGDNYELQRFSDDGEPSKTAGKPMLDVLVGNQIHDAVVVVTRYFGGTLLGTGGLVRAYQRSVSEALKHCILMEKRVGVLLSVKTDYQGIGKIQHIIGMSEVSVLETIYLEEVELKLIVDFLLKDRFIQTIIEATNANANVEMLNQVQYGKMDNQCIILS